MNFTAADQPVIDCSKKRAFTLASPTAREPRSHWLIFSLIILYYKFTPDLEVQCKVGSYTEDRGGFRNLREIEDLLKSRNLTCFRNYICNGDICLILVICSITLYSYAYKQYVYGKRAITGSSSTLRYIYHVIQTMKQFHDLYLDPSL
jgi:hypothetical protein